MKTKPFDATKYLEPAEIESLHARIEELEAIEELKGKLLQFADLVIEELNVAALADCESGVASLNKQASKKYLAHFPQTYEAIHKIKDKAEEILDEIEDHDG